MTPRRARATRVGKQPRSVVLQGRSDLSPNCLYGSAPFGVTAPRTRLELETFAREHGKLVALLQQREVWVDAAGNVHLVAKMEKEHALNTLVWLHETYGAAPAYTPLTDALRARIL